MDSITIKVSDLRSKLHELIKDKMDYLTLTILEPDGEGDDALPACLSLSAVSKDDLSMCIDYEEIEAVSEDEFDPHASRMHTNIRP